MTWRAPLAAAVVTVTVAVAVAVAVEVEVALAVAVEVVLAVAVEVVVVVGRSVPLSPLAGVPKRSRAPLQSAPPGRCLRSASR